MINNSNTPIPKQNNDSTNASENKHALYKQVAKMLQKGLGTPQIAAELGLATGEALALIRETKKNVTVKDVPFHIKHKKVLEEHNALGHTSGYIAKILNARKTDVQRALMRLGLEDNEQDASVSMSVMTDEEKRAHNDAVRTAREEAKVAKEESANADAVYLQMIARKHKTDKDIAKALGKGLNQTRVLLDKNNIEYEVWQDRRYIREQFPATAAELEEMLYEHTIGEIAEKLGVSYTAARRAVHDAGLAELANTRMRIQLDKAQLMKYVEEGLSIGELCDKFGVGYSVVRYNLDEYGLEVARKVRPAALDAQQCRDYVEAQMTIADIVEDTGLGYWAVRHSFEKAEVAPYVRVAAYKELMDTQADVLSQLADSGHSMRDIAKYTGTSYESVRRALAELGIETNGRGARIEVDEAEIARLAAEGYSMQKIADALEVSREVVKNRIANSEELSQAYANAADARTQKTAEEKRSRLVGIQDPEELALIKKMALDGCAQREICEKTGRTLSAVRTALAMLGVKTNATGGNTRVDIPEDALRAYIALGMSPEDIAEDLSVSRQIVYSRLREAGLTRVIRTRSDAKAAFVAHALSYDNLYRQYVDERKSVEEIARTCLVDKEAVYRAIRLHGISRTGAREEHATLADLDIVPFDDEQVETLKKMSADNKSAHDIANALNVSIASVYAAMGEHDIYQENSARPETHSIGRAAAVLTYENLYKWRVEENKTVQEIADEQGVSRYTVYDYLRRAGLGGAGNTDTYKTLIAEHENDLIRLASEGKSVREIAEALNSTHARTRAALKYLGIETAGVARTDGKMTYRELAEKYSKEISAMAEEGRSVREIAEALDSTRERIKQAMGLLGVKPAGSSGSRNGKMTYRELAETYRDDIAKMAGEGKSVRKIAEALDSTRERVKQAMELLGVEANGRKQAVQLDEEKICEMLLDGDEVADVAEELGVSASVIYAALRKWGRTTVGTKKK